MAMSLILSCLSRLCSTPKGSSPRAAVEASRSPPEQAGAASLPAEPSLYCAAATSAPLLCRRVCPSLLHRHHGPSPLCHRDAASAPRPCATASRKGRRGYLRRTPARRRWPLQVAAGGSGGSARLASCPCCVNRWRLGLGVAPASREKTYVGWARVQDGPTRVHFWAFNRPGRMAQVSKLLEFIFLRILAGYGLVEYLVRIRTGYVSAS
jgi:hypothetical protein